MIEARKNVAATKAKKFLDKRSYVTMGGKTYLFGKDVERLRRECYERSVGYCEMKDGNGARCRRALLWDTFEMHHEPPLSKGGWDHLDGVLASCKRCHVNSHGRLIGGRIRSAR